MLSFYDYGILYKNMCYSGFCRYKVLKLWRCIGVCVENKIVKKGCFFFYVSFCNLYVGILEKGFVEDIKNRFSDWILYVLM